MTNKELSEQEIKPVAFLRYKNGEIDWGENCLAHDQGYALDCCEDDDENTYTEVALYPESAVTALRAEIERLKGRADNYRDFLGGLCDIYAERTFPDHVRTYVYGAFESTMNEVAKMLNLEDEQARAQLERSGK